MNVFFESRKYTVFMKFIDSFIFFVGLKGSMEAICFCPGFLEDALILFGGRILGLGYIPQIEKTQFYNGLHFFPVNLIDVI